MRGDAKSCFLSLSLILQPVIYVWLTDMNQKEQRPLLAFKHYYMAWAETYIQPTCCFFRIFLQMIPSRKQWGNSEPPHLMAALPWNKWEWMSHSAKHICNVVLSYRRDNQDYMTLESNEVFVPCDLFNLWSCFFLPLLISSCQSDETNLTGTTNIFPQHERRQ